MELKEKAWDGMDEINLAEDTEKWRGVVNVVIDLEILQSAVSHLVWKR